MLARLSRLLLVVLVLVPVSSARAEAPGLANGRRHYQGARFEQAERAFAGVVEDGASSTRADLAEAYRYLSALRLVRGLLGDAEDMALRALSLRRELLPPEGAPADATALFDAVRARVPEGGVACRLELPPRPVASAPVGVRIHILGDPAELVATASLQCGGRVQRVTPERRADGAALAVTSVDGGPAGRRTECIATLHSASNVLLASSTGTFVAAEGTPDMGDNVLAGAGRGRAVRREPSTFPWVWVGIGAGVLVVAGVVIGAFALASGDDDAYVGRVVLTED